ncbi:MAG: Hpt domain-containing protein [Planctomycetota bacterium]|nr:MAG: Hpt domain-containing protein [Planctomycetota bacterium]
MPETRVGRHAIHSVLSTDPELQQIVAMFVEEMPNRVARIERQWDAGDRDELRRSAHQLKGALGSYGFDELTPHALRLESLLAAEAPPDEVAAAVSELVAYCRRITATPR